MAYVSRNPRFDSEYWTDQQATAVTSPPSGAMRFFSRFGQIFRRNSSGLETMVSYDTPNYVTNPAAYAGAATGLTIAASGFTVTRGTTQATFSKSYFNITGNTTVNKTVDWTMTTLNVKDNSQIVDFNINAKVVLNGGSLGVYKIGVWDGAAYVTGTTFNLSASVNEFAAVFTLNTATTYTVRLEATTAGDAADVIYVDGINLSPRPFFPATASFGGYVSTSAQNFGGVKTFNDGLKFDDAGGQTTLNNYTESTSFTPTIGATGTGFSVVTYGVQVGKYNRTGNKIDFALTVQWTNTTGSPTGSIAVNGLPVTSVNTANLNYSFAVFCNNLDLQAGAIGVTSLLSENSTSILMNTITDNGTTASILATANGGAVTRAIIMSGTYFV